MVAFHANLGVQPRVDGVNVDHVAQFAKKSVVFGETGEGERRHNAVSTDRAGEKLDARVGMECVEHGLLFSAQANTEPEHEFGASRVAPAYYAELRLEAARQVLNGADALLVVGSKIGESELWGGVVQPAATVVRVDVLESQLNKNLPATHPLLGDVRRVLPALADQVATRVESAGVREPWTQVDAVLTAAREEALAFAPVEYTVAGRIAAVLPKHAIVAGDSSQITYYGMSSQVRSTQPHSFLYMAAYATLGYGLPAAIGAKVASPERPVVGVIGDGALMFSIQEFQTAVEQQLDLTIVCVDNGGYGEIQQNEADRGIAPIGVQLAQPNWPALVEAFGGTGFAVTDEAELEARITEALETPGVTLVHVPLGLFRG